MSDTNLSAVLYSPGDLKLAEWPVAEPKAGEVQLAIHSVGICGSDVKYWTQGSIGHFVVKNPMVLGHESSGTVVKLGEGVTNLKVGDRVTIEPGVPCRVCEHCKEGEYNLCQDVYFCATPPDSGTLTRLYCHAADFCYKLPDQVSYEEGALLEPLSVGVHACRRAGVNLGSSVLICGAGPIGLMSLVAAKAMGAAQVCIVDIAESRLEFAKDQLGASHTIKVETSDTAELVKLVHKTLGCKPRYTIECSGAEPMVQLGIAATRPGGVMSIIGHGPPTIGIPMVTTVANEIDIRGCFRYCNDYQIALSMIASGQINVKPMITHRYKLENALEAFATTKSGQAIKVMIKCAKE